MSKPDPKQPKRDRSDEIEAMVREVDENYERTRTDRDATELLVLIELHFGLGALLRKAGSDRLRFWDLDDKRVVAKVEVDITVRDSKGRVIEFAADTFFERVGEDLIVCVPSPETQTFTARRIRPDGFEDRWVYEDELLAKAARAQDN